AAIIYFIPLADRLEILVMLPDGLRRFASPIGQKELTEKMHHLHDVLAEEQTGEYQPASREAYDLLFAPLAETLAAYQGPGVAAGRRVDTLVFVPDGALRNVP